MPSSPSAAASSSARFRKLRRARHGDVRGERRARASCRGDRTSACGQRRCVDNVESRSSRSAISTAYDARAQVGSDARPRHPLLRSRPPVRWHRESSRSRPGGPGRSRRARRQRSCHMRMLAPEPGASDTLSAGTDTSSSTDASTEHGCISVPPDRRRRSTPLESLPATRARDPRPADRAGRRAQTAGR